jgi:hypothetical protein
LDANERDAEQGCNGVPLPMSEKHHQFQMLVLPRKSRDPQKLLKFH